MSKTKTKEVETALGTVEVETVECDSCGQRFQEKDAYQFTIENGIEGHACEMCTDDPISFPPRIDLNFTYVDSYTETFGFIDVLFSLVITPLIIFAPIFDRDCGYEVKVLATNIISAILWTVVLLQILTGGFL